MAERKKTPKQSAKTRRKSLRRIIAPMVVKLGGDKDKDKDKDKNERAKTADPKDGANDDPKASPGEATKAAAEAHAPEPATAAALPEPEPEPAALPEAAPEPAALPEAAPKPAALSEATPEEPAVAELLHPQAIPQKSPTSSAPAPGLAPPGDSRSFRRHGDDGEEFCLIYRFHNFLVRREGQVGQMGSWSVIEYPNHPNAANAYAQACSRLTGEGYYDFRG